MTFDGTFDDSKATDAGGRPPPGDYTATVVDAEIKTSRKGDGMMSLLLKLHESGWKVYDVIMLSGPGAGIGKSKAKAFGILLEKGAVVEAGPFLGKEVRVYLAEEEYDGKTNLAVDIGQGEECGYDPLPDVIPF